MSVPPTRARRSTPTPKVDALAFRLHNDPTFVQAVNRAANLKCLAAIKSGRLRVVQNQAGAVGAPLRYSPRMDIVDDPSITRVVAMFELPGIRSSDIALQIREGNLVITGTRTMPSAETLRQECNTTDDKEIKPEDTDVDMKGESPTIVRLNAPIQELRYGSFYRAIRIPEGIQESDVRATLHEGMLRVTWPRVAVTQVSVIPASPPPSPRTLARSPTPGHPPSTNNASQ